MQDIVSHLEARLGCAAGELLIPGATVQAISEVEERLGENLPADFRDFLLLTDGLDRQPGDEEDEEDAYVELKRCGDLEWDDAFTAADDDGALPLEVEPEFQDGQREACTMAMPFQTRPEEFKGHGMIDISDDSDNKRVWLISPKLVRFAREHAGAGLEWQWGGEAGWRVLVWRHWCPDALDLYKSFTEYLRAVAMGEEP